MKNLKIPELVHDELKVYSATKKENMSDIGGIAIMRYLAERGHKFIMKTKSKPKIKNKQ